MGKTGLGCFKPAFFSFFAFRIFRNAYLFPRGSFVLEEEDAFGSDFASTDEEGAQEDVDAVAERMVQEEEKTKRKVSVNHIFLSSPRSFQKLRIMFPP